MREIESLLAALHRAPHARAALATLVTVTGSSYRRPGARLLLLEDGTRLGSISGGCLEDDIVIRAKRVLATGTSEIAVYDTTEENDLVWGVGLGCQGVVRVLLERLDLPRPRWLEELTANLAAGKATRLAAMHGDREERRRGTLLASELPPEASAGADVFRETIAPRPTLRVYGAGDDAQPLVRLAWQVGWSVTVIDARPAYATAARFPEASALVVVPAGEAGAQLPPDPAAFAVVMTHRYADDVAWLRELFAAPLAYLGVLGPRKRTERILAELAREGCEPDAALRAKLFAPVGLDLGATLPATIAVAIVAEMQAVQAGRTSGHLRDRARPIHA